MQCILTDPECLIGSAASENAKQTQISFVVARVWAHYGPADHRKI
jgi:hypothetical protein